MIGNEDKKKKGEKGKWRSKRAQTPATAFSLPGLVLCFSYAVVLSDGSSLNI